MTKKNIVGIIYCQIYIQCNTLPADISKKRSNSPISRLEDMPLITFQKGC